MGAIVLSASWSTVIIRSSPISAIPVATNLDLLVPHALTTHCLALVETSTSPGLLPTHPLSLPSGRIFQPLAACSLPVAQSLALISLLVADAFTPLSLVTDYTSGCGFRWL